MMLGRLAVVTALSAAVLTPVGASAATTAVPDAPTPAASVSRNGALVPIRPVRVLEPVALAPGQVVTVKVAGAHGIPSSGVTGAALRVRMTLPAYTTGEVRLGPAGSALDQRVQTYQVGKAENRVN